MPIIECSSYELIDFERYLKKCKDFIKLEGELKKLDKKRHDNWDDTEYDLDRIDKLLLRVKGERYNASPTLNKNIKFDDEDVEEIKIIW